MKTDLSRYNNDWYQPGSSLKRLAWLVANALFFKTDLFIFSGLKVRMLRVFGARVGKGVLLKPGVSIKYPWFLRIGDHTWVGEGVWIDNLAPVTIGSHVCLSQGVYLLTGNHNFKEPSFDLMIKPIVLEDGVWIGAKATVCPGVVCRSHSVLAVGSVATADLQPFGIYQGNPALLVKERVLRDSR